MYSEVFHSACWQQALFLVRLVDCFLLCFGWFFTQKPQVFSSQACSDQYYAEYSGGPFAGLWGSRWCSSFLSDILPCSCLSCTGLISSAPLREAAWLSRVPRPMLPAGNSLQAVRWASCIGFTSFAFHFSGTTVLCYLVSSVFKTVAFYIVWFLVVWGTIG